MAVAKRDMQCALCGSHAGRFHQHYNRDNGHGICGKCVDIELDRTDIESILSCYGVPGYHYQMTDKMREQHQLKAWKIGGYAKKHGVPETFNPYPFPKSVTSNFLTRFDAYEEGFQGGSWENFSTSRLRMDV